MILTDRNKPWWFWWAVGVGIGLILVILDRPLIMLINPMSPIPWLDRFFNIYTDIGSWLVGLPCLLLILSSVARLLKPRGVWGYPALSGLAVLGILCMAIHTEGAARIAILLVPPLVLWLGYQISRVDKEWLLWAEKVALCSTISIALGGGFITGEMKKAARRPRPLNPAQHLETRLRGFQEELLTGETSFPSGHSSSAWSLSFPFFLALRRRRKNSQYVFLAIPFMNALSRVYLAVHFPTDVYVGSWLGVLSGYLAFRAVFGPGDGEGEGQSGEGGAARGDTGVVEDAVSPAEPPDGEDPKAEAGGD